MIFKLRFDLSTLDSQVHTSMSTEEQPPPVVGTLTEYSEAPFARRSEWAKRGDLVRITGSDADHHMAVHPDYIETVLFNEQQFKKLGTFESVFGEGVFTVYGDQWRAQRRAMNPAFRPEQVARYTETIADIVSGLRSEINEGATVDARELFVEFTVEVMLETLFGGRQEAVDPISRAAEQITEWFLESATVGEVPDPVQTAFDRSQERLVELIDEMIDEAHRDPSGNDLLSMLVAIGAGGDANYTPERIRDEVVTMLFAAHETTALTLTYAFYLIAESPSVERRLRAEIEKVVGEGVPTPDQLDELQYTEQVVDETLRLYCPAHAIYREATEEVQIDGYTIPKGDVVHISQWVTHRDERWWNDPTEFRPERFSDDDPDRPTFAFFPFGVGPRRCIGEPFARAEAVTAVAGLIGAFSVDHATENFELRAGPTAVPDRPIEMVFSRRS